MAVDIALIQMLIPHSNRHRHNTHKGNSSSSSSSSSTSSSSSSSSNNTDHLATFSRTNTMSSISTFTTPG